LAREPQVVDESLNSLARALNKCETLYKKHVDSYHARVSNSKRSPLDPASNTASSPSALIDGSVLIAELAASDNPLDACNQPLQTPLLHSISHVHSIIYLLITLGKINQNDVRHLTIGKWGSPDLGVKCLRDLSKLYMSLIWESSMLLWLCNEEQQTAQLHQLVAIQQLQQAHLNQLIAAGAAVNGQQQTPTAPELATQTAILGQLNQLIQQFSSATSQSAANVFEFNRADLERIKQCLMPTPVSLIPAGVATTPAAMVSGDGDSSSSAAEVAQQPVLFSLDNQSERMDVTTSPDSSAIAQPPSLLPQVSLHFSFLFHTALFLFYFQEL
jgi:hypothetical protein